MRVQTSGAFKPNARRNLTCVETSGSFKPQARSNLTRAETSRVLKHVQQKFGAVNVPENTLLALKTLVHLKPMSVDFFY